MVASELSFKKPCSCPQNPTLPNPTLQLSTRIAATKGCRRHILLSFHFSTSAQPQWWMFKRKPVKCRGFFAAVSSADKRANDDTLTMLR